MSLRLRCERAAELTADPAATRSAGAYGRSELRWSRVCYTGRTGEFHGCDRRPARATVFSSVPRLQRSRSMSTLRTPWTSTTRPLRPS